MMDGRPRRERRLWGPDVRKDVDDELAYHLEMREREFAAGGMSPEEARERARRKFGNPAAIAAACREIGGRRQHTQRRASMWNDLRQDLGYAVRQMIRNAGFTCVALLTLALGIGGATAMFSVVNAAVLRPLPYPTAERLVSIAERSELTDDRAYGAHVLAWRERSRTLDRLGAYTSQQATLTGSGEPERLEGVAASVDLLPIFAPKPHLGRHFNAEEDRPGGETVVILSYHLWQRLGGNPEIIGRQVTLDGTPHLAIAVLPAGFRFFAPADFWVPLGLDPAIEGVRQVSSVYAIGQLRAGTSAEDAQSDLEAIRQQYEDAQLPGRFRLDGTAIVVPLQDRLLGDTRHLLLVLLGAVGVVLLIACANVANLLLARAITREREYAVRGALGAGRFRLVRQMLTESALLAAAGATLGLIAATYATSALAAFANQAGLREGMTHVVSVSIDARVLAFTATVTALAAVVFGVAPALQSARADVAEALRSGSGHGGRSRARLQQSWVVVQIALTIVLLAGAGLLVRSFAALLDVDPGYRASNLLTVRLSLPETRYSEVSQREAFFSEMIERVAALPSVELVAVANNPPLTGADFRGWPAVAESPAAAGDSPPETPATPITIVSPDYFQTMGIPILAGRGFTAMDDGRAPRAIVLSESLARQLFPGRDPIHRRVLVPGRGEGVPTVVGVAADVRHDGLDGDSTEQVYVPFRQQPWPSMMLLVRSTSDPLALVGDIKAHVLAVDPLLPLHDLQTMEQRLAATYGARRTNLLLLGAFAALALALAAVGLYGVMGYAVSRRTHEIGLRIALGARPVDVLRLIAGQGMRLVFVGAALGIVSAWALTRLVTSLLFGVTPTDPLAFGGAVALLVIVAFAACVIPARRALLVNVTETLKAL